VNEFLHIFDRSLIHLVAGPGLYLLAILLMRQWRKRWPEWYERAIPALLILPFYMASEAFDMVSGQTTTKLYFDIVTKTGGLFLGVWGLYRYDKWERDKKGNS